eukprot:scaffold99423_cov28-Tisochrysis_lutea.AAC.1
MLCLGRPHLERVEAQLTRWLVPRSLRDGGDALAVEEAGRLGALAKEAKLAVGLEWCLLGLVVEAKLIRARAVLLALLRRLAHLRPPDECLIRHPWPSVEHGDVCELLRRLPRENEVDLNGGQACRLAALEDLRQVQSL